MFLEELSRFQSNSVTIPMYIDTGKMFIQLGTGVLALTVLFRENILGETGKVRLTKLLSFSWASLLLSMGAAALYQYRAVKFLESLSPYPGRVTPFDRLTELAVLYAVMLVMFFLGTLLFILSAGQSAASSRKPA